MILAVYAAQEPDLCCPVSLGLFVDPVAAADGFVYERPQTVRSPLPSPSTDAALPGDGAGGLVPPRRSPCSLAAGGHELTGRPDGRARRPTPAIASHHPSTSALPSPPP